MDISELACDSVSFELDTNLAVLQDLSILVSEVVLQIGLALAEIQGPV